MYLRDGTVIPSFLGVSSSHDYIPDTFTNEALRVGEVKEIIYPDDARNLSKKFIEYSVEVQYKKTHGPTASIVFPNCILINAFASLSDVLTFTLRQPDGTVDQDGLTNGSSVLILCVNGDNNRAVILGGIRDPGDKDAKADGHNLRFEFNGIEAKVNNDGELIITRKSATDNNGNPKDSANANAQVVVAKDGTIRIGYATEEGDKPSITWDKNADTITIHGNTKVRIEANNGPVEIETSSGVKINEATEAFVRGTTYREQQAALHKMLIQLLEILAQQHLTAGAGLPSPGGPIISSMSANLQAMKQAIVDFEKYSDQFLSKKHFHED